jgi:prepilin-type processing-associated H-X9-DG protein
MRPVIPKSRSFGFSRTDFLACMATVGLLLICLLSISATTRTQTDATQCFSHLRDLQRALDLRAADYEGRFPNNPGFSDPLNPAHIYHTWAPVRMSWDLISTSTNEALLRESVLAQYLRHPVASFKCPRDRELGPKQKLAGWKARLRSYSMNGFVGFNSSDPSASSDRNTFFPNLRQFLRTTDIRNPAGVYVFLEEHPDSINDGFFINAPNFSRREWLDIPASRHDRAINLSFADGHVGSHRWKSQRTVFPVRFSFPATTFTDAASQADYRWLIERMFEP